MRRLFAFSSASFPATLRHHHQLNNIISISTVTSSTTPRNINRNMTSKLNVNVEGMRESYSKTDGIDEAKFSADPFLQFRSWFSTACEISKTIPGWEANAMCLSTISIASRPTSRMVLLKSVDERGFIWYTNYNSGKGTDLSRNPYAALNFYWYPLEQSVRIEGIVEKVPSETSDTYFKSRPIESQIGAIVSQQSQPMESSQLLRNKYDEMVSKKEGLVLERPQNWGGYRLIPDKFEFWKGRDARLHDRIVYQLDEENKCWNTKRLQP